MSKDSYETATTGAVKDPENDGRLKENRDAQRTLGTTEHSAQAPNVRGKNKDEDDETSLEETAEDETEEAEDEEEAAE